MNLTNRKLFAKISLANIHRYIINVFGISTDCSLFAKFFSPKAFSYLYGLPKFSPAKNPLFAVLVKIVLSLNNKL